MNSSFVRKTIYLAMGTLLLIISTALIANFNVQTAHAQIGEGGGYSLGQVIADQISLKHIFTIYTTTQVNNVDTYIVHPQINIDYYVDKVGADVICLIKASDTKQTRICIPFSAIAAITYR